MSASSRSGRAETGQPGAYVALDPILREMSLETQRLAEQCGRLQWSISAILDTVDHPDLGAETHMLQDIDRIQQTLHDLAAVLHLAGNHVTGAPLRKEDVDTVIRLESLRQRLGLSKNPADTAACDPSDITWL